MNDSISRQAAIDALDGEVVVTGKTNAKAVTEYIQEVSDKLKAIPSAEAEPVKHGRWLTHPSEREWDVCSYCHIGTKRREYGLNDDGTEWVTEESYTYCPHCGAKMEGTEHGRQ